MKQNIKYFLKVIIWGCGVIPATVSSILLLALLFLCGIIEAIADSVIFNYDATPYIMLSLAYILAAFFAARMIAKANLPDKYITIYLPFFIPPIISLVAWAVSMRISHWLLYSDSTVTTTMLWTNPGLFIASAFTADDNNAGAIIFFHLGYYFVFTLLFTIYERKKENRPKISSRFLIVIALILISLIGVYFYTINERKHLVLSRKDWYKDVVSGHGFKFANGYSSVDLEPYYVGNKDNILAKLDAPSSFNIKDPQKMPILDGAEAAYPIYNAFALAVYGNAEKMAEDKIRFTNTVQGYQHLLAGKVDIFFSAAPSQNQIESAQRAGKELVLTPIAKEAFIFFVSDNNPIDNLTESQIKDIYSGKIRNWKSVSGKNSRIYAFQRPENSGSQTMMQKIMGDTKLMLPPQNEIIAEMGAVIEKVADYEDYPGAIGYSFRYFATKMAPPAKIKVLSINGIYPNPENISDGSYPYTGTLYAITLKDNKLDTLQPFLEWMQGDEGQKLIEKTGYIPL